MIYFRLVTALVLALFLAACAQDRLSQLPSAQTNGSAAVPGDADEATFLRMGDKLSKEGQFAAATAMYQRAISKNPNNATGFARLGDIAWQSGQLNAAADLYAKALQRDQTNPEALLGRARALALASENDAAMLLVNDLIQTHGPSYKALALKAMLFDLEGDHVSAQTLFLSAIDREPRQPNLRSSLAYSHALEGDYRSAVDILRLLGEQQSTAAMGQYALADIYAMSGQTSVAMELRQAAAGGQEVSGADKVFLNRLAGLTPDQQARALYFRELPTLAQQAQSTPRQDTRVADAPTQGGQSQTLVAERTIATPTVPQATETFSHWVQIASFQSRAALELAWYQIQRAQPDVARQLNPSVQTIDIVDRGTFHRLYAGGYTNAATAGDVCKALRDADLSCVVVYGERETMTLAQALASQ